MHVESEFAVGFDARRPKACFFQMFLVKSCKTSTFSRFEGTNEREMLCCCDIRLGCFLLFPGLFYHWMKLENGLIIFQVQSSLESLAKRMNISLLIC